MLQTYVVRDAHIDDPIVADVMYQIVAVQVGKLVIDQLYLRDDLFGHLGEITDTVRVPGQHGLAPRHHAVQDRHCRSGAVQ